MASSRDRRVGSVDFSPGGTGMTGGDTRAGGTATGATLVCMPDDAGSLSGSPGPLPDDAGPLSGHAIAAPQDAQNLACGRDSLPHARQERNGPPHTPLHGAVRSHSRALDQKCQAMAPIASVIVRQPGNRPARVAGSPSAARRPGLICCCTGSGAGLLKQWAQVDSNHRPSLGRGRTVAGLGWAWPGHSPLAAQPDG